MSSNAYKMVVNNICNILTKLKVYFDTTLTVEKVQDIIDCSMVHEKSDNKGSDDESLTLHDLLVIKTARIRPEVLNLLLDLCTECRSSIVQKENINETNTWEAFTKYIVPEQVLTFFFCLIGLIMVNANDKIDRRIALTSARGYLLILAIPGAKAFGVFHEKLFDYVLCIFDLLNTPLISKVLKDHEKIDFQINCISMLEDLESLLNHMSLEEHADLKQRVLCSITAVMQHYHEHNFKSKYSYQLYEQCYPVLDKMCQPIQGDVQQSLSSIVNVTARLNKYNANLVSTFRQSLSSTSSKPKYETISSWFIEMLEKFPNQTSEVLTRYIKAILTNTNLSAVGGPDQLARNLNLCAKYDSAMYVKCNKSCSTFLRDELSRSRETIHRVNCVEIIGRILTINSVCEWQVFRDEVAKVPREIQLLQMLFEKFTDINNNVKIKSVNMFLKLTTSGNVEIKKILKSFMSPIPSEQENQIIQEESVVVGIEELNEYKIKLMAITKKNLTNASALVRKAFLNLLEYLGSTAIDINQYLTSPKIRKLHKDPSPMVRKQLILTIDNILNIMPTNEAAIIAYAKVSLDLANDVDPKVVESVMDSFKRNIFDKINRYELTATEKQLFPWRVLRAMLYGKDMPDLRGCINNWISKKLLTERTLSYIETHINTPNAAEAWILLSMIAPKIKSKNPEVVVTELMKNLQSSVSEPNENSYIQLGVLLSWIPDLNQTSQNEIFRLFTDLLLSGSIAPDHIQRVYEICAKINRNSGDDDNRLWAEKLHKQCEEYILQHQNSLIIQELYNEQLISYIFTFSEVLTDIPIQPNEKIVNFFYLFLDNVIKATMKFSNDSTLSSKVNSVLILLTRLALFNRDICDETVKIIGKILNKINQSSIILTSIRCLGDLCKKHTSVVQRVLPNVLAKTQHNYHEIRNCSLQVIATLVMDDFIKFRGVILIYILAAILDKTPEISQLASELILKYTAERNEILIRTCLLECAFVLNGYTYFDNFGIFSSSDFNLPSPLTGDDNRSGRQFIYRFFIYNIDTIYCYFYFENFHMILDKLKTETLMKTPEGLDSVKDFLYICTQICIIKEKSKKKLNESSADNNDGDNEDEPRPPTPPAPAPETTQDPNTTKKTRSHKGPTIEKALMVVEKVIPMICELNNTLYEINHSFVDCIDSLCSAICEHFDNITDFAQPRPFWAKYKKDKPRLTSKKYQRIVSEELDEANEQNSSNQNNRKSLGQKQNNQFDCSTEKNVIKHQTPTRTSTRTEKPSTSKSSTYQKESVSDEESDDDIAQRKFRIARKRTR